MQPSHAESSRHQLQAFSILVRIEPHATLPESPEIRVYQPFSILVRIEPHATALIPFLIGVATLFQYPRADRASCNAVRRLR